MLEEMPGPGLADAARQGAQTSRVTAKKPWQLGVALLTLFGAAVLPERSLVLPQDKAPLHESMYAEGRRLYAAVHGLARPATGASTVQDIARPTISVLSWAAAPCASGQQSPQPAMQHTLGRTATGSASATASPAKRARDESGSSMAAPDGSRRRRRQSDDTPLNQYRCLACNDVFGSYYAYERHMEHTLWCEDAEAGCELVDVEQEARDKLDAATGDRSYALDIQQHLVGSYADLQYDRLVARTCIQSTIKEQLVEPLVSKIKDEIFRRLAKTPQEQQCLEKQIGAVFEVHAGIETEFLEEAVLRRTFKPVKPVKRELVDRPDAQGVAQGSRRGDFVYDVPMKQELEAMLAKDPSLHAQLKQASEAWATERPEPGDSRTVYADFCDGEVLQSHPGLGRASDRSDGTVRLAFILYYDDLEVVNPLGAFHGTHKLGMFYWALVNIEPSERMSFHNLHLMTVALVSDIDYYGIEQVISGLPGDDSFGSAMTALDSGMDVQLAGGSTERMRGWCICLSADYPAAALCSGFKKSVSAVVFCRECYLSKHDESYPAPTSFLEDNGDLNCECCLRDKATMDADFAHFQTLSSDTAKAEFLTSIGMNSFSHAFTRVPHFDISRCIPYDFMHCELEGTCKNELAAMLFYFLRKRPTWGFTLEKLNAAIRSYVWPAGFAPPTFTAGYLEKGTKDGKCKTGCHVHMTSGDMAIFMRHSIDLLLPLIKDTADPLWRCWVAHAHYVRLLLQHSLTHTELVELDRLIYEHHKLFLAAEEYGERLFKPKNHFACHFPSDILNHGPVRNYWCMRFEALNQMFKTFAKTGSFKNTCGRCAGMWTTKVAIQRTRCTQGNAGQVHAVRCSPPTTYQRDADHCFLGKDSVGAQIVDGLFAQLTELEQLTLEWVPTFNFGGTEYRAGQSWLQATYDGQQRLAYFPEQSVFRFNGRLFALLHLYPAAQRDQHGLPTITIPEGFEPEARVVALSSPKLQCVTALWLTYRVQRGTTTMYRFTPLL